MAAPYMERGLKGGCEWGIRNVMLDFPRSTDGDFTEKTGQT